VIFGILAVGSANGLANWGLQKFLQKPLQFISRYLNQLIPL
jgi:hypothetical protein